MYCTEYCVESLCFKKDSHLFIMVIEVSYNFLQVVKILAEVDHNCVLGVCLMPKQIKCFQVVIIHSFVLFLWTAILTCPHKLFWFVFFSTGIWCYLFAEAFGTFIKNSDHILWMAARQLWGGSYKVWDSRGGNKCIYLYTCLPVIVIPFSLLQIFFSHFHAFCSSFL